MSAVFEFYSREKINFDKKLLELLENIGIILGRVAEREISREKINSAYNSLKDTQAQLIHNERLAAIGKFSSGLAHEIRNPLANIIAAVQYMIKKYDSDGKLKENLEIIERNGKSANQIISEMLSFASPTKIVLKQGDVKGSNYRCSQNDHDQVQGTTYSAYKKNLS